MIRSRVATWIVAGLLIATPGQAGDLLRPLNAHPSENGALVDGLKNGIQINDQRYVELDLGGLFNALLPVIPLENFVQARDSNEILAFSRGHPPALIEDVPWTAVNDTIDVQFEDEYRITVYVWIVKQEGERSAQNGNMATSAIWKDERQGVAFDIFDIIPAWDNPNASNFHDFTSCSLSNEIKAEIGHNPDGVNIYYVDRVDIGFGLSTFSGIWCFGGKIIAMGKNASGPLLAHELGHAFSLGHTNQDTDHFDTTNVMHSASNDREFLTEGQTYRAVFQPGSVLNNIYTVREGEVTRPCGTNAFSLVCPRIYRRVWADGSTWPTN